MGISWDMAMKYPDLAHAFRDWNPATIKQIAKGWWDRTDDMLPLNRIVEDHSMIEPSRVLLDDIARAVASKSGITLAHLYGGRRDHNIAHPRQIAMYLSRQLRPDLSLPEIGQHFKRDHTTIMHGIKAVKARLRRHDEGTLLTINACLAELDHDLDP